MILIAVAFESAGWDVTSIVRFILLFVPLHVLLIHEFQVYAFPQEGPTLVLADAATIKVTDFRLKPRVSSHIA